MQMKLSLVTWGFSIVVCWFLCVLMALSTRLMRILKFPGNLFMTWWAQGVMHNAGGDAPLWRGDEWSATCVPVQGVLSQCILNSSATCDISACSEGSPTCYRQLAGIFNPAHAGSCFKPFLVYPTTLLSGSYDTSLLCINWLYNMLNWHQ